MMSEMFSDSSQNGRNCDQNARLYRRVFETESTLRQSEKMNTLGLLVAEIAHEIRNPLTVIKLLLNHLRNPLRKAMNVRRIYVS